MRPGNPTITLEEVLENSSWLSGLARHLVDSQAAADDIAQQTWEAALQAQPHRPLRPWLAEVLRNFAITRLRRDGRRTVRERKAQEPSNDLPTAEDLLARAEEVVARNEMARTVSEIVASLPDPYRSTVLFCYFDGTSPTEVARQQGIPASTVRVRLKRALAQIREELDRRHDNHRRQWHLALIPLASMGGPHLPSGTGSALRGASLAKVAVALVVAGGVASVTLHHLRNKARHATVASASSAMVPRASFATPPSAASILTVLPKNSDLAAPRSAPEDAIATKQNVFSFDFEDFPIGAPPANFPDGLISPCPPHSPSPRCLLGTVALYNSKEYSFTERVSFMSVLTPGKNFLTTYSENVVLGFDYWVSDPTAELFVLVWDTDQKDNYTFPTSDPRREQWLHAELRLADFVLTSGTHSGPRPEKMVEGDSLRNFAIVGSRSANKHFYVDNLTMARYQPGDLPKASTISALEN